MKSTLDGPKIMTPNTMLLARKAMMVKIRIAAADLTTCQRNASK